MDRAYPALRQMFTDIRNVWFEKMGRELHNFSLDLRDFLYGLQNHPTHQWHERFHAFAAGQRFQGRYMTPESEDALLDYISRWAAKKVIDSAPEVPDVELDPNAFDLTEAERAQARDGLFWWHAKPFEWGDGWWEEKFKTLANAARDKMLETCRELQTLGLLARNVHQLPDDGIDSLAQQADRVHAAHDAYVQALIDIERSYLSYIKSSLYVGWLAARLIEEMAGDLPAPLFELPSSKLRALAHARAEVDHALGETGSRVDMAYKVAYWVDIAITAIEFATGVIGVAKAVLKREIAKGAARAIAKKIAIRAAIKQAAIQGAVLLGSLYGLPILINEAGFNPDYVFAGVLILQGLTAFQALRSLDNSADINTRLEVLDNDIEPHPGRVRENLRSRTQAERDELQNSIEGEMEVDLESDRGVWDSKGHGDRGFLVEDELEMNLPQGFPTFDRFDNGVATSIKSLDTWLSSYIKQAAIRSRVNGYIDKVADFERGSRVGVTLTADMIKERRLLLAIPRDTTPAQWLALLESIEYGKQRGVVVEIVEYR